VGDGLLWFNALSTALGFQAICTLGELTGVCVRFCWTELGKMGSLMIGLLVAEVGHGCGGGVWMLLVSGDV
jgi:hypothetical protein